MYRIFTLLGGLHSLHSFITLCVCVCVRARASVCVWQQRDSEYLWYNVVPHSQRLKHATGTRRRLRTQDQTERATRKP